MKDKVEVKGIEPGFTGWEFRVLTTTGGPRIS